MTMSGNLILLVFLSALISINGQYDDERDLPQARQTAGRSSKESFDGKFLRGRCPQRFYQSGEECLYFATDGKVYSWDQAERACSRRIARMLDQQSWNSANQPNIMPTKGVRQLVLNTPEKTEIFRALFREYNEQNYAVRLPSDYNTLERCRDAKDDNWPYYCTNPKDSNATCFETVSQGTDDICLREIECRKNYLRLACEFTLPGSDELTNSKFRYCPKARGVFRRLPLWAWITIGVGSLLLLLAVIVGILGFLRKSKSNSSSQKKSLPEPRSHTEEKPTRLPTSPTDPASEPMLTRAGPTNISDTGYLQPRSSPIDNSANA